MIFAEQIFGGVQIRRSQKKLMLIHVCNQNPFTLIFRYHYSIEELGGREGGGGGTGNYYSIEERGGGGAGKNPARNAAPRRNDVCREPSPLFTEARWIVHPRSVLQKSIMRN